MLLTRYRRVDLTSIRLPDSTLSLYIVCIFLHVSHRYKRRSNFSPGHWGLSAPNADEVRLTEHNDLAAFLEVCKSVGVLAIVRPGYASAIFLLTRS